MPLQPTSEAEDLISRALCEVLDSVIAPRLREIVLDDALAASHTATLPTEPAKLVAFIRGSLRESLIQAVGEESVDAITTDLERIIDLATARHRSTLESAGVRRRSEPPRRRRYTPSTPRLPAVSASRATTRSRSSTPPTLRVAPTPRYPVSHAPPRSDPSVPPLSSGPFPMGTAKALTMAGIRSSFPPIDPAVTPVVLVASLRSDLAHRLTRSLAPYAETLTIHGVFELVREVGNTAGRTALLLDCEAPSIRPVAVAALADELPSTVQVVLWGASPDLKARLMSVSPRCQTWVGIDTHTDVEDVAGRCAILVC